jgi:hypothetical protein
METIQQHGVAVGAICAGIAHLAHVYLPPIWERLKHAYPYAKDNGGVWGIVKTFFVGQPKSNP